MSADLDLKSLEKWERAQIEQVLKRNKILLETDEMRVHQLAVRTQLQRKGDHRTSLIDKDLRCKSGQWHKELVKERLRKYKDPKLEKMLNEENTNEQK